MQKNERERRGEQILFHSPEYIKCALGIFLWYSLFLIIILQKWIQV